MWSNVNDWNSLPDSVQAKNICQTHPIHQKGEKIDKSINKMEGWRRYNTLELNPCCSLPVVQEERVWEGKINT